MVRFACDNTVVVDALNKHSVKGDSLQPLQSILLIAAVYDIAIQAFWIPSEENKVADAASRFDYKRLADLGLQVFHRQPSIQTSTLRRKLNSSFTTPLLHQPVDPITTPRGPTNSSIKNTDMSHSQPPSKRSRTGLQTSWPPQSQQRQELISPIFAYSISNPDYQPPLSTIHTSNSSSEVPNVSMEDMSRGSDILSPLQSYSNWSIKSYSTKKKSISKRHSVWHLPSSYDLENLHGIHGPNNIIDLI